MSWDMMRFVHILFAVLASWRLTEAIIQDRIFAGLRKRFPTYLLQCSRCLSVWSAGFTTVLFVFYPWANWPLAIAWLYLVHLEVVINWRSLGGPRQLRIEQEMDGSFKIVRSNLTPKEVADIGKYLETASATPPKT